MKSAVLALSILLVSSSQQKQPATEVTSSLPAANSATAYDPFFAEGRPYWERRYKYYVDPHVPRVDVYDKDKSRDSIKVNILGTNGDISLSDATISPQGKLIISGGAMLEGGKHFQFVGVGNRDGSVSPLVDTGKFVVTQVSTCDEDTVWTLGWLRSGSNLDEDSKDAYFILRQYRLSDGKLLTAALNRTLFAHDPTSSGLFQLPDVRMQCRGNTLGIYEEPNGVWIEYRLDTGTVKQWKLPYEEHPWVEHGENPVLSPVKRTVVTGVAMTDTGEVYASFFRKVRDGSERGSSGLFKLHKKAGENARWVQVAGTLAHAGDQGGFDKLEGTDGKNLVYSRFGEHHWFFSPAPR